MLIATFKQTTGCVGKAITFEKEQFILEGHGPITAQDVAEYDHQGYLTWPYDGMRAWALTRAGADGEETRAPSERHWAHRRADDGEPSVSHRDEVARLVKETHDSDLDVRRNAVDALGSLQDPGLLHVFSQAMSDEDGVVRASATRALGMLESPAAFRVLGGALRDEDAGVRVEAVGALGRLSSGRVRTSLEAVATDPDARVRRAVGKTLNPQVVGASCHQTELETAVGGHTGDRVKVPVAAEISAEPGHPRQPHAVRVQVNRATVGYLARDAASGYYAVLRDCICPFPCGAEITGGGNRLGSGRADFSLILADRLPTPDELTMIPGYYCGAKAPTRPHVERPGFLLSKHHSEYAELVRAMKRCGQPAAARALLTALIEAVEEERAERGGSPAPWYYEQYAIVSRKLNDRDAEVEGLRRFVTSAGSGAQDSAAGRRLTERLQRAERRAAG